MMLFGVKNETLQINFQLIVELTKFNLSQSNLKEPVHLERPNISKKTSENEQISSVFISL